MAEGGILSPFSRVKGRIYAEDTALLRSGNDIWKVALDMQEVINIQSDWGKANNLHFNADKTKVMIFSRRYKIERPILMINRKVIEYVDTIKYLGVVFDSKLTWKAHIKEQVRKAKASLMRSQEACTPLQRQVWKHY